MKICIIYFESQLAYLMYRCLIEKYHVKVIPVHGMIITEKMMAEAIKRV